MIRVDQALLDELRMMEEETRRRMIAARDASFDGLVFYGVRSTGIYCKPSCQSRRPRQGQVVFFDSHADAESARFRPYRRCRPPETATRDTKVEIVERACRLIEASESGSPALAELSVDRDSKVMAEAHHRVS